MSKKPTTRRDAVCVFVFFLCAFALTNSGFDTSEAIHHYKVAKLFVATGQIGFENVTEASLFVPLAEKKNVDLHLFTTAKNGWTYASHEFGNTLLLIPTAAVNGGLEALLTRLGIPADRLERLDQFTVSFQAGFYAALTLTILFLILTREYGLTTRTGFLACLALGFGTYFWNYSRYLFDGVLCGLLLMAALWFLVRYRATGSLFHVGAAFSLLGLAVDTRLSMIIPTVVGIAFVVAVRPHPRWAALVVAIAALAPFAAWQMWYNHLRTGHPLLSPVQTEKYAEQNALDGDLATGLIGQLVSPGKGLFVYAPLLIVSVMAFPRFWRRDRAVAAFVLAVGILWLLLHAKLRSWYGAGGWGPRLLITILPVLAIPGLVQLPEMWARLWSRAVVLAAIVAGCLLAAAGIIGNYQYRTVLGIRQNRLGDETFVWGWHNQALDMLMGAGENLAVVVGAAPPLNIPEMSELNNYASNRINVWWLTLPHAGIPRPVVVVVGLPMLMGLIWSGRRLLSNKEP